VDCINGKYRLNLYVVPYSGTTGQWEYIYTDIACSSAVGYDAEHSIVYFDGAKVEFASYTRAGDNYIYATAWEIPLVITSPISNNAIEILTDLSSDYEIKDIKIGNYTATVNVKGQLIEAQFDEHAISIPEDYMVNGETSDIYELVLNIGGGDLKLKDVFRDDDKDKELMWKKWEEFKQSFIGNTTVT